MCIVHKAAAITARERSFSQLQFPSQQITSLATSTTVTSEVANMERKPCSRIVVLAQRSEGPSDSVSKEMSQRAPCSCSAAGQRRLR